MREVDHSNAACWDVDQEDIGCFNPPSSQKSFHCNHLCKATTSVSLSLAVPETTAIESDESLLSNPEAIWTVITASLASRVEQHSRQEATHLLTPLAQFIRGLCYAVRAQRLHAEDIVHQLKDQIKTTVSAVKIRIGL